MKKVIPYGRQSINNDDFKAISKTIKSDYFGVLNVLKVVFFCVI